MTGTRKASQIALRSALAGGGVVGPAPAWTRCDTASKSKEMAAGSLMAFDVYDVEVVVVNGYWFLMRMD